MCGDTAKMSSCLDEILAHANVFEDCLNASAMFARLLSSLSKHREAITNCLDILAKLGEEFPSQPDLATVQNKLSEVQPLLLSLSADKMKALPTMTDINKLQAMKFLGMLCEISSMAAPMLLPLISVRMMKLTFQFGFCNDSILGIFYTASSVVSFVLVKGEFFICSLQNSCIDGIDHEHSFSL
jgi:predicted ATPase